MVYADTDFFLALLKDSDWLKSQAEKILQEYSDNIETSLVTFIELLLLAKKFNLPPIKLVTAVMKIANYDDSVPLLAAKYIDEGVGVFDSFHAAFCKGTIISSDHIFDALEINRIKIEDKPE